MKKVSVIIVNYNTARILKDCLQNLDSSYPNLETIVVDNGSKDNSVEIVKKFFPKVVLIEAENKGLAAGSNLGLSKATGDYILYLGSDAFPEKGTIHGMVEYMEEDPSIGIATCRLVLRNGALDKDAHRGFPTPWTALTHFMYLDRIFSKSKLFNRYFLGFMDMEKPHEIDMCISHFMLVKKEVFERVGKWDEDYFLYGEDVDFCYRVKQSGYRITYLPQFKAVHYKGASVGIRKETQDISKVDEESKRKNRQRTIEAMKIFYKKHMYKKYPWAVNKLVELGINLMDAVRAA